ncbi:MAG: universal stress protein [Thermoanaerobaculia bacterium]
MSDHARPVVCATDLSDASDEAVRQADALARHVGSPLVVVHILPNALRHHPLFPQLYPREASDLAALEGRACEAVSERVVALTGRGAGGFRAEVDTGTPSASIVRRAEELNAEAVVVGGRRPADPQKPLLGDTAEKVVRHAHCPVLVARSSPAGGHVLVATDLSDPSLPAVQAGAAWARRDRKPLTVLHVLDLQITTIGFNLEVPPGGFSALSPDAMADLRRWAGERLAEALRQTGAEGEPLVEEGWAPDVILRVAARLPAELIVIGTIGRTGIGRMLLGSVAEGVVRRAPCSVLVTRLAR